MPINFRDHAKKVTLQQKKAKECTIAQTSETLKLAYTDLATQDDAEIVRFVRKHGGRAHG